MHFRSALVVILASFMTLGPAQADMSVSQYKSRKSVVQVPAGNRNASMPAIPGNSTQRRKSSGSSIEGKYRDILSLLQRDRRIRSTIFEAARRYRVAPELIFAAIIGEHSFNYNILDTAQSYGQMAITYFSQFRKSGRSFATKGGLEITQFLGLPEVSSKCGSMGSDYDFWSCSESVWDSQFRGRRSYGYSHPKLNFNMAFFNPWGLGQTYGLGQLSPLAALKVNDLVARTSGLPHLSVAKPEDIYKGIMDTDTSIHYVAATIRVAVDAYRRTAGFDITTNPGVVATLYNLGKEKSRAYANYQANLNSLSRGQGLTYPEENFVGWLVNEKINEIRSIAR